MKWQPRRLNGGLMATKQQIDRLAGRIDELRTRVGLRPAVVTIQVPKGMDEALVVARHHKLYPRDRHAELTVTICLFGDVDPDAFYGEHENPKNSRAWR